jgi:3-hydroxy acid dehydrogenase/malonic semialdehyde reductase
VRSVEYPKRQRPYRMTRYLKRSDLTDKHAVITGASSGIGRACAFMLAEKGVKLTLVARRANLLSEVKDEILANHPHACISLVPMDITDLSDVASLPDRLPPVDILVNNAGLALGVSKADTFSADELSRMMQTNAIAAMAMFRAFVPQMRARDSGHVVTVGSVAAFESYEGGALYNASKHAILGFINAARMDLVDTQVKVTLINPGIVDTEFWNVRFNGDEVKVKKALDGIEPLSAWDVADQIVWALTRHRNCQISEIRSYCTHQAHAKYVVHRK